MSGNLILFEKNYEFCYNYNREIKKKRNFGEIWLIVKNYSWMSNRNFYKNKAGIKK